MFLYQSLASTLSSVEVVMNIQLWRWYNARNEYEYDNVNTVKKDCPPEFVYDLVCLVFRPTRQRIASFEPCHKSIIQTTNQLHTNFAVMSLLFYSNVF